MKEFTVKVNDPSGIHARPAGLLVKKASEYDSDVKLNHNEKIADCKRIFSVMSLTAKYGDILTFNISGPDEEKAAKEIKHFFENNL